MGSSRHLSEGHQRVSPPGSPGDARAGTHPGRNQIWAVPEPKITRQLPGKRGKPSVHRSCTCQEGSHLHPSLGITAGSIVFSVIQWITAERLRKTVSRSFWAAKQQTADTPRASSSIWGRAAMPGSRRGSRCSCAEEQRPHCISPLLPQEAAAAPEQLGAPRTCKLILHGRVLFHPWCSEQARETGKKMQMCKPKIRRHQGGQLGLRSDWAANPELPLGGMQQPNPQNNSPLGRHKVTRTHTCPTNKGAENKMLTHQTLLLPALEMCSPLSRTFWCLASQRHFFLGHVPKQGHRFSTSEKHDFPSFIITH